MTTAPPGSLLKQIKLTAGSRFRASERLRNREEDLSRLISYSSVYSIILSCMPLFFTVINDKLIGFTSVVLTMFILVASLKQGAAKYLVDAEKHKNCALELDEIKREIEIAGKSELEFIEKYNYILQKHSINHSMIDYLDFKRSRESEHDKFNLSMIGKLYYYRILNQIPNMFFGLITIGFFAIFFIVVRPLLLH